MCNCLFSQLWPINEVWNNVQQLHFFFSWLCTAVAFQRSSRFCPLAHVRTFIPALSFRLYYVDLDFIERGSLSEARSDVMAEYGIQVRGLSAVFTESRQLYAQRGNFEFCSSSFETDSLKCALSSWFLRGLPFPALWTLAAISHGSHELVKGLKLENLCCECYMSAKNKIVGFFTNNTQLEASIPSILQLKPSCKFLKSIL